MIAETNNATLLEEVHRSLTEAVRERRRAARLLGKLNADVDAERQVLQAESDKHDQEQGRVSEAAEAVSAAERESLVRLAHWAEAYRQWCAAVVVLAPASVPEVVPDISSWCEENIAATSPVRAAWIRRWRTSTAAWHPSGQQKSRNCGRLKKSCAYFATNRNGFRKVSISLRHRRIRAIRISPRARWAPFWMLCEFFEHVPAEHRARLRRPWNRRVCWTRG